MTVGIVGLGLIGGSIAKAIKDNTDCKVLGRDISEQVMYKARLLGVIDGELEDELLSECDLVIVAIYPGDTVDYVISRAGFFKRGGIVLDCCGIKRKVCDALEQPAKENGFIFVGGHPMAGREFSGFEYSKKNLFEKASMILTPYEGTKIEVVYKLKTFFLQIGFYVVKITAPEEHDRMIAFTSQLAHVVSNAYVKSPSALNHKGFFAGSYRDMTRVAKLNAKMWTELFLANSDNLVEELDSLIERLKEYSAVIKTGEPEALYDMLREGSDRKKALNDE